MRSLKLLAAPVLALGIAALAGTAEAAPVSPGPMTAPLAVNAGTSSAVETVHYRRYWHRHHRHHRPGFSFYVGPRWGWVHNAHRHHRWNKARHHRWNSYRHH